mmetsp:Transcript_46590/g.107587  ORF Transcript_46590/g.107587 Transcript_46590/m.107587 type:complete len:207 (+) Transcript_46590:76-696(+)
MGKGARLRNSNHAAPSPRGRLFTVGEEANVLLASSSQAGWRAGWRTGRRRRGVPAVLEDTRKVLQGNLATTPRVSLLDQLLNIHALEGLTQDIAEILYADGARPISVQAVEDRPESFLAEPRPSLHRRREEIRVVDALVAVRREHAEELVQHSGGCSPQSPCRCGRRASGAHADCRARRQSLVARCAGNRHLQVVRAAAVELPRHL